MKLLDLNIWKGQFLENIVEYVKKEDFDILTFQEVSANKLSANLNDNFEEIKARLNYEGFLNKVWSVKGDPSSYEANAILFKKSLSPKNPISIFMKDYQELSEDNKDWASLPRSALFLDFLVNGQTVTIVTAHMAWGPTPDDKPYKEVQAEKLNAYLSKIQNPLILTGDFNLTPNTRIISSFSKHGVNLTAENNISNTLNPRTHKVKELFPKGLAVDYIFVSDEIKVKEFKLIDQLDLSDHLGLWLAFEL